MRKPLPMGIAVSLLICAAAAAQIGAQELPRQPAATPAIAIEARATAQILAGAQIRFDGELGAAKVTGRQQPQLRRDVSGALWLEFS